MAKEFPPAMIAEARRLRREGLSLREIGRRVGCCGDKVKEFCAGIESPIAAASQTKARNAAIATAYKSRKHTVADLAAMFGVSEATVENVIRRVREAMALDAEDGDRRAQAPVDVSSVFGGRVVVPPPMPETRRRSVPFRCSVRS